MNIYQNKLEDAWTKLTLVQDNAKAHRKEYLVKKCEEARSQEGNKPKAEKLRAIISSEYSAWLWPKLHRYAKGEIRTGLNRIEKPIYDDTGEIIEFQTIYWFKRDVLSLTATEYDSFCTSPAYPIC